MDFNKVLTWLVTSSKDPKQLSLTVKGALIAAAPLLMYVLGLTEADFNQVVVEAIVAFVFAATTAISALQIAYGLLRKVNFGRWSSFE